KVLKNTFADIKEVKVEEFKKKPVTGSYGALVTMTNNEGKSVYFDYSFWKERNELGGLGIENRAVQKTGVTIKRVKVIFSNGQEELV
ncbi:hypothetical protein, partial [Enterococcus faecium]|uniref:hypothetical protein n=2 Tax=Enterococcus TaxID=1350 RepID=UPI00027C715F